MSRLFLIPLLVVSIFLSGCKSGRARQRRPEMRLVRPYPGRPVQWLPELRAMGGEPPCGPNHGLRHRFCDCGGSGDSRNCCLCVRAVARRPLTDPFYSLPELRDSQHNSCTHGNPHLFKPGPLLQCGPVPPAGRGRSAPGRSMDAPWEVSRNVHHPAAPLARRDESQFHAPAAR